MRHLGIVASSAPQASAPSITINSTTNFNQDRATFNATVNPNGATTSVKFQYKRNVDSTWIDGETITGLTGTSQSVYSNQTGLAYAGTLYDVRAVATNSAGTTTSSNTTFTTWSLKTYRNGPSGSNDTLTGSQTFTIPTITPTGGSQVVPTVLNLLVVGGGGGSRSGWKEGAGGGGYRTVSSRAFSNTSTTTLSITIGAGGAANTAGGTSTITASNFTTLSATGGNRPTDAGGSTGTGGSTPANDNSAYSGGTGIFVLNAKSGESAIAGGGGAGAGGNGTNGTNSGYFATGGNGGAGYYYSTGNFNVGPGGFGTAVGTSGQTNGSLGANSGAISGVGPYGKGGNGPGGDDVGVPGSIGVVYFQYYAA